MMEEGPEAAVLRITTEVEGWRLVMKIARFDMICKCSAIAYRTIVSSSIDPLREKPILRLLLAMWNSSTIFGGCSTIVVCFNFIENLRWVYHYSSVFQAKFIISPYNCN